MAKSIILNKKKTLAMKPKPPYNFNATIFKPGHYPDPLKIYETGKYWFAMRFDENIYGLKMENLGTINKPKVGISIFSKSILSKSEIKNIVDELNFRFEFTRDILEFFEKFKTDKIFSPFLKRWRGMHGSCAQDLYGLLMIGIFLQNTVAKRTVQMTEVMLKKYGVKVRFSGKELI